jgi:hypothetical protein
MLKFNRLIYCALLILAGCADHAYQQYQGQQQNWPTAPGAFVEMKDNVSSLPRLSSQAVHRVRNDRGNESGRFANAIEDAAHANQEGTRGDVLIVVNHADRAEGSVTYANAFGNFNAATGTGTATGMAVNIPRRVDKATLIVIKWK